MHIHMVRHASCSQAIDAHRIRGWSLDPLTAVQLNHHALAQQRDLDIIAFQSSAVYGLGLGVEGFRGLV